MKIKEGLFPHSAWWYGETFCPYHMETKSVKELKKTLGQLTGKRGVLWLLKAIIPLHPVAYHMAWWMPGPPWTTSIQLWYSSPRHMLLLVAGAERGMVPMILTAFLRSCGYSKPSYSCLWSKVMTFWGEITKAFEPPPWQQAPFALSSHGTHSSSRAITEYDWAKYAHGCREKFFQRQILPQSFHSGTMRNVYAHSTDCSLAEAVNLSLLVCSAAALLVTHKLAFSLLM